MRTAPTQRLGLSRCELLRGKPFLRVGLLLEGDCNTLLNYSLKADLIHKPLNEYADHLRPQTDSAMTESPPYVSPGDTVCLKDWKSNTLGILHPKWKGLHWFILCTPTAGKLEGLSCWSHKSRRKPVLLHRKPMSKLVRLLSPVTL